MKLGFVGNGLIVRTCLETLDHIDGMECAALCVRPQSAEKGEALAKKHGIGRIYTDYDAFLSSEEFKTVYIGIVNPQHYIYTKRALLQNKNVILEKPFVIMPEEARELADIARARKLFLFEAITTLHKPMFKLALERLNEIGPVSYVQCNYSQFSSRYKAYQRGEVAPVFDPAQLGGALYDLNVYNLHAALAILGAPERAVYFPRKGYNAVDLSGTAILTYAGAIAACTAAKDAGSPGFIQIQGESGYIRIDGASNTCPALEIEVDGKLERFTDPAPEPRMAQVFTNARDVIASASHSLCLNQLEHSIRVVEALWALRKSCNPQV